MFRSLNHLTVIILISLAASLHAAERAAVHGKAGLIVQHFHYEEFDAQGKTLNQEEGVLPGIQFSLSVATEQVRHQFQTDFFSDEVDYDGKTQGGMPHQTTTETRLFRLGYRLESDSTEGSLAAYLAADWHYWSRSIQSSGFILGLDETYSWPSVGLGLSFPLLHTRQHSLNLSAGYLRILTGRFSVDLSELGYSKREINLGTGEGGEFSLLYAFALPEERTIELELFAQRWSFDESSPETLRNSIRSITFVEPRSKSMRIGLAFRISAPF